ncbi:NTP transferase domain-containing protein [Candidatus Gracilibacteria bacterium]|nr:NTP transferase domain-containing protein [Candidatus Gracilibacteria bacterium]
MKAIILAAGEGSRLRPLTNTIPKPMIKIFGKPILEHNIEHIYKYVKEIIIVVKYKAEIIESYFGNNFKGVPIKYHLQNDEKGTGAAIKGLKLDTEVLILNGDSIFDKDDLKEIIKLKGYGVLVKKVQTPEKYGIFKVDNENKILEIVEKPEKFIGDLANLGVYKLNSQIFQIVDDIKLSKRGEYEITDALNVFANKYDLKAIEIKNEFIDVGYPWDILNANSIFLNKLKKSKIKGKVEKNVTIKGNVIIEEGAIIKSGTYIEGNVYIGKNSSIGPNAYIRGNSTFGENCKIGNAVEIKNCSLGDNSHVSHLSYIGDSIIGNNVNIGGGFISANLRHDNKNIKVMVKGELIDSKLRKLGIIIGDNVKTGIKSYSMPGRIIENDTFTMPGEIIK